MERHFSNDELLDDVAMQSSPRSQHTLLVAGLLHLMSHYTVRSTGGDAPCIKLASVIERHLEALARLPDADPVLRATCERLAGNWAALVDARMPPPRRQPLLARILAFS